MRNTFKILALLVLGAAVLVAILLIEGRSPSSMDSGEVAESARGGEPSHTTSETLRIERHEQQQAQTRGDEPIRS